MKKLVFIALVAVLVLTGCTAGVPIVIPGQMPAIESFDANPASISAGEYSTLSWTVSGATSVSIDQGIGGVALTGSRAVSPAATIVYTLTASSSSGSVTATTQVIVAGAVPPPTPSGFPTINSFMASPSIITLGDSTSLSWNVSNATSVSINHGVGSVSLVGNIIVSPPTTTTYTLTAGNANGSVTAAAVVQVSGVPSPPPPGPPVILYFTGTPLTLYPGGSSFLRWNVSNASSVTIDNGIGLVDTHGTMAVSPPYSTVYTLTATNPYGFVTKSLSIMVSSY